MRHLDTRHTARCESRAGRSRSGGIACDADLRIEQAAALDCAVVASDPPPHPEEEALSESPPGGGVVEIWSPYRIIDLVALGLLALLIGN